MLYRVLKPLDTGHQVGDVVDGRLFKQLARLEQRGCLAPVSAPPLRVLPGWKDRWQLLPVEWQTIEALIATPAAKIAAACGVTADEALLWQVAALEFLKPKVKKCRCEE